jgi:transposase
MREAFNAIKYVLSTGSQWRYLPENFPPRGTVYRSSRRGVGMACWIAFMRRVTKSAGRKQNVPPVPSPHHRQPEREERRKRGLRSIRASSMRARRSRARSAICLLTRRDCCCMPSFIPPAYRIATTASCCLRRCLAIAESLSRADFRRCARQNPAMS